MPGNYHAWEVWQAAARTGRDGINGQLRAEAVIALAREAGTGCDTWRVLKQVLHIEAIAAEYIKATDRDD